MNDAKIVAYEPGAAHVYDRSTGEQIGYVLQNFHGNWTAMRDGRKVSGPYPYRSTAANALLDPRSDSDG